MDAVRYVMSTIRSDKSGFASLGELSASADGLEFDELILDFECCEFFDANMVAPLQAALQRIERKGNAVKIVGLKPSVQKILQKNEFLCSYGFVKLFDSNLTTLPYRCFGIQESRKFSEYLENNLSGKNIPRMSEGLGKRFRQSIFEIFQNCAMHSQSTLGVSVCGQFYPKVHKLDLTISDGGVGIRTNARKVVRPTINSVDAIAWAITEGATSKTGNEPGGFGLKLLHEFVELNRGKVQIVSRQGYYEFDGVDSKLEKLGSDLRGTTVNLEINTNDKNSYRLKGEVSPRDIF